MGKLLPLESLPLWKYTLPLPDAYQKRVTYLMKRYFFFFCMFLCQLSFCRKPQPLLGFCTFVRGCYWSIQIGRCERLLLLFFNVAHSVLPFPLSELRFYTSCATLGIPLYFPLVTCIFLVDTLAFLFYTMP